MSGESSGFSEFAQGLAQPAFVALDGIVVWANAAWPHSPLQARVVDLFRVDPVAMERTLGFAATRESVEVDWTPVGMHESLRWTLRAAGGRLYGLSARRQEQTRTDREQMLLMGEQMTRTGFWSIDLASGEAWWSDEVYRIHGYAPASVPAMFQLGLDHYLPEDRARVRAIADYAIASGEPYEFEADFLAKLGALVERFQHDLVYARFDFLRDAEGQYLVTELELVEPSLFFRHDPAAADRLADAVVKRMG